MSESKFDKKKANSFPFMFSYCHLMGSGIGWTNDQIDRATKEGASCRSMFYSKEKNRWITFDEYEGEHTKTLIVNYIEKHSEIELKMEGKS